MKNTVKFLGMFTLMAAFIFGCDASSGGSSSNKPDNVPKPRGYMSIKNISEIDHQDIKDKYVYAEAEVEVDGKVVNLYGMFDVEGTLPNPKFKLVQIKNKTINIPMYKENESGTKISDKYVAYNGSDRLKSVAVWVLEIPSFTGAVPAADIYKTGGFLGRPSEKFNKGNLNVPFENLELK